MGTMLGFPWRGALVTSVAVSSAALAGGGVARVVGCDAKQALYDGRLRATWPRQGAGVWLLRRQQGVLQWCAMSRAIQTSWLATAAASSRSAIGIACTGIGTNLASKKGARCSAIEMPVAKPEGKPWGGAVAHSRNQEFIFP